MTNMLDNAAKWSPPGGTITVRLHDGELRVGDRGRASRDEDLPHVFDRFYRSPTARRLPGSGPRAGDRAAGRRSGTVASGPRAGPRRRHAAWCSGSRPIRGRPDLTGIRPLPSFLAGSQGRLRMLIHAGAMSEPQYPQPEQSGPPQQPTARADSRPGRRRTLPRRRASRPTPAAARTRRATTVAPAAGADRRAG